ncbi:MAG: ABC transporter permease [Roseburia sp.]|nr:ABC transporter permease [Roseburia sp.]
MKKRKCNMRMVFYELRNINGNLLPHFFGIVFPNFMCYFLSKSIGAQAPEAVRQEVVTTIMLTMTLVMPMAIMLLGYGAVYSQEVEREIPLRMHLFGLEEKSIMLAKIIAHFVLLTIAFVIFAIFQSLAMDIQKPAFSSLLCLLASLYLIGALLLIIAHAIANLTQRFSVTFGVGMILYFAMMILTGMMGMRTEQLPTVLQRVAYTLPMTYISNDFIEFWQGGSYNFMPFIQSFLFLGAVAGLLLLFSQYKGRRRL